MPPLKGGERVTKVGGLRPLMVCCDHSYAVGFSPQPPRGVWGHAPPPPPPPPRIFEILDTLRAFLVHFDGCFEANLIAFFLQ